MESVIVEKLNGTKDASISVASSPIKNKIPRLKEKTVAKKSQPGVKKRIRKHKRCSHEGCANEARKRGFCVTHGAKLKQCNFKGCTKYDRREEFAGRMVQKWR